MPIAIYDIQGFSKLSLGMQLNSKTSQKWLTVAIFQNWQDSCVALWIETRPKASGSSSRFQGEGVTGKGQDNDKIGMRQRQDRDKTGTR